MLHLDSNKEPDLSRWDDVCSRVKNSEGLVRIAVVGKYTQLEDAYKSLSEALIHGGLANKTKVETVWFDSEDFEKKLSTQRLNKFDGILIPGGFGKRGTEGKINVIKFAREANIPFLGICLGMQLMVIEYARNMADILDANSEEFKEDGVKKSGEEIIYHLSHWFKDQKLEVREKIQDKGGTMRLGAYPTKIKKGSIAHSIYKALPTIFIIIRKQTQRYEIQAHSR